MKLLFVSLVATLSLLADDIYYHQGHVYRNVQIIDTTDTHIRFESVDGILHSVSIGAVGRIVFTPIDTLYESRIIMYKENPGLEANSKSVQTKRQPLKKFVTYEYPNLKLIPVAVIGAVLAFDNFKQASDIGKRIDLANEPVVITTGGQQYTIENPDKANVELYKTEKGRRIIYGIVFTAASLVTVAFVFDGVEVRTDGQRLSLAYSF